MPARRVREAAAVEGGRPVTMQEFMVPSDPGIEVYVRNKHPTGMLNFSPERTVLFVHGATYPAHTRLRPQAQRHVVDGLHGPPAATTST